MRAIGTTDAGRYVFLVLMLREIDDQAWLRPISARICTQKRSVTMSRKLKSMSSLRSDADAEAFTAKADLSE